MDLPLDQLVSESASDLLSISQTFEPCIPKSPRNAFHSLELLGRLGEITRLSLNIKSEELKSAEMIRSDQITSERIPQSQPASAPESINTALPVPPLVASAASRRKVIDQSLVNALLELRKTNTTLRKSSGTLTSILKV